MITNSRLSYKSVVVQDLVFPIQVVTDPEKIKNYHREKLYNLSLKTIGNIPQLEEPDYWQKQWVLFRLSHSNTWPKVHENKIGDFKNWK